MKIIAFDAAHKRTGYAYRNGTRWVYGVFPIWDCGLIADVISAAVADHVTHAVIEDPYCGMSVTTLKSLQDAASRIAQRCEDAGLLWAPIKAAEWHSAQGCTGKGKETKIKSMALARHLDAPPYLKEDEADAVCLCDYAERNMEALAGRWRTRGGVLVK